MRLVAVSEADEELLGTAVQYADPTNDYVRTGGQPEDHLKLLFIVGSNNPQVRTECRPEVSLKQMFSIC